MKKYISLFSICILLIISACTQSNFQTVNSQDVGDLINGKHLDTIPREEYITHNTIDDCWIVYENSIYDITDWLNYHPGSAQAMAPYCGTIDEFQQAFSNQHGQRQIQTLQNEGEIIGKLQ